MIVLLPNGKPVLVPNGQPVLFLANWIFYELSIALGQAGDDVLFAWVSIKSYRSGRLLDMKTNRSLSLGCLLHKTSKLPGYSL